MSVPGRCQRRELDPTGSQCRNSFLHECVNLNLNETATSKYNIAWANNSFCRFMAKENKSSEWLQDHMNVIFSNVYGDGTFWPSEDAPDTQRNLYFACKDAPYACRESLFNICSRYTNSTLQDTRGVNLFCGCYLPYSEYSRDESLFNIKRECSGLCHNSQVVPYTMNTGEELRCTDSLCIINDININLVDSTSGDIVFNQLCGTCGDGGLCRCKISDVDITAIEAKLGDIEFDQNCQGDIDCFAPDPNNPQGPSIKVDCVTRDVLDTSMNVANLGFMQRIIRENGVIFYGGIAFIVLALIIIVILFLNKGTPKEIEEE